VETFDVPGAAGENGSMPSSINTKGEVAGLYYSLNKNGKYVPHGFLRKPDGTIKTFRIHSDSGGDFPSIVNSAGAIIGAYFHGRTPHGFIRDSHGTITTFDCPCGPTYVSAGNDFNAATGPGGGGGFVRNPDGTFTLFNAGQFTAPLAINDQGSVTGTIGDADAWEGFLRTPDGTITLFVVSDAANGTRPDSINADGVITGRFGDETGAAHGFIRAIDGTIVTFDPEGSASTYPASINDKGAIAGSYYDGVHYVGFVRTP
jgi:hypothetical protein